MKLKHPELMKICNIYTDASWRFNHVAGYGVYFQHAPQHSLCGYSKLSSGGDNNMAEFMAVCIAVKHFGHLRLPYKSVNILTDSMTVWGSFDGSCKIRSSGIRDIFEMTRSQISALNSKGTLVNVVHVHSRSGSAGNRIAHKLARRGRESYDTGVKLTSRSNQDYIASLELLYRTLPGFDQEVRRA